MKPWIMPKLVASKKTGQLISSTTRANRFGVNFELGGMGVCAADAEAMVQDAMNNLVAMVRKLWAEGKNPTGQQLEDRSAKVRGAVLYNRGSWENLAKHEAEVLNGTYKINRKKKNSSQKDIDYIAKQKEFVKDVKRNYMWKGKVYHSSAKNYVGTWSGLLSDSLTAEKVTIKSRSGKIPTRVTCRLTVAPSRGAVVIRKGMNKLDSNSAAFEDTSNYLRDCVKDTTQFKSYKDSDRITLAKLQAIYNSYRAKKQILSKIMKTAARFI